MILTSEELVTLIRLTQQTTVAEFNGYKVVQEGSGWTGDSKLGPLQAKLSIMLEMASKDEAVGL